MHVLDFDGGLVDASCLGIVAALRHFRRPDVSVVGGDVRVHSLVERVPVPLAVLHQPLCVSLAFFHAGETVLVDATLRERILSEGELVVTANAQGEVCQLAKLGGVPTEALTLLRCVEIAVEQVKGLSKLMQLALDRDEQKRKVGTLIEESKSEADR